MKKRKRLGISEIPKFSFLYIVCIVVSTTVSSSEKETRHNSRRDRYIFLQPWRCLLRKATEQSSIMVRKLHIPFWYWKKNRGLEFLAAFLSAMMSMLECLKLRNQRPERMAYKKRQGMPIFKRKLLSTVYRKVKASVTRKEKASHAI